jgi:hypothetical protein
MSPEAEPMASLRKRGRVWYFRYSDADGVKHEVKGCSDKRATEELARGKESEVARIRAGLMDPRDLAQRIHDARPLSEHLADYRAHLIAKGATAKYADLATNRTRRVAGLARADRLSDLSGTRFQGALKTLTGVLQSQPSPNWAIT